jgi:hypothetical protein
MIHPMNASPPAFPNTGAAPGMTLREWFAGQALLVCMKDLDRSYNEWASEAYALADAMLAERTKSKGRS